MLLLAIKSNEIHIEAGVMQREVNTFSIRLIDRNL